MEAEKQLVFFINSKLTETPGGRENWIANIAPHLQSRGYKTTVICRRSNKQPLFNTSSGLNIVRFNDFRSSMPDTLFISWAKRTLGLLLVFDMIIFVLRGYQAVKTHLERGGILAWGVVPTSTAIREQTVETMVAHFEKMMDNLASKGIDKQLIVEQAIVTPSCGAGSMEPEDAEKVFEINNLLSKAMRGKYGF